MDEEKKDEMTILNPSNYLMQQGDEIVDQILNETDASKSVDLVAAFKANLAKRNVVRSNKLSTVLDMIDNEIIQRVAMSPDAIQDKDLIGYLNAAEKSLQNTISNYENTPVVQVNTVVNKQENTINLTSEERRNVLDAVNAILSKMSDGEVIDLEELE